MQTRFQPSPRQTSSILHSLDTDMNECTNSKVIENNVKCLNSLFDRLIFKHLVDLLATKMEKPKGIFDGDIEKGNCCKCYCSHGY